MATEPTPTPSSAAAAYRAAGPVPIDFTTVVLSLHESALIQLGIKPDAAGFQRDLDGARAQIDMLCVLAEKTRGNLSDDEDRLVRSVLFELQVAYVERAQA